MEKVILVLGASRYDFKDEQTGRAISGVKLTYVDFSSEKDEENMIGYVVSNETIDYHRFHEVNEGSGFYAVTLNFDLSGKKPKVIFEKLRFVSPVNLNDLVNKKTA